MSSPDKQNTEPTEKDLSGRQLGDYRLLRRLGRGAMAEVYLAEQASLSRQVAFKVLRSDLAKDETYVRRFQREAQAAAALVHANIVQIHEVGQIDHVYFIAQEYVQGQNLRQWISRNGTPDLRLALIVMRQVAAALTKASEQGIVHRDVKPENIMITRSGEVKVADFGLARRPGSDDGVNLTQVGMTMGTPLYMSPEQVEGHVLDSRSDIYSFGITCYHMLSGSPPFDGETALSVAVQHLKKTAEPLENIRTDLPPGLCRVVHKMMVKSPEGRYRTPREVLKEIHKLQLEHLEEDWPEDLPGLETAGIELAVTSRNQTAQRLEGLMKAAAATGRNGWVRWVIAAVTAFLVGATLAWYTTGETPLLAETGFTEAKVERFDYASSQYMYATQVGTEDAWKAVIAYFPNDTSYTPSAKQNLARIYLRDLRDDNDQAAMDIFKELANLPEEKRGERAFGLAGQCVLLSKQGKHEESAVLLAKLSEIVWALNDRQLGQHILHILSKNRSFVSTQATQEWEARLKEQLAEEPDETVEPQGTD